MGLMETLIKKLTPDQASPRVSTPASAPPSEYPREVLRMVSATWQMGMSHFNGERTQIALAQLYCGAVRERLLDEIEEISRPSEVLLADMIRQARPSVTTEHAFAQLSAEEFDSSYGRLRIEYRNRETDIRQIAEALTNVVDIVRYLANVA